MIVGKNSAILGFGLFFIIVLLLITSAYAIASCDTLRINRGSSYLSFLEIKPNGNVLIGTTTDNGYKLQVAGSERVYGDLIVDGEVSALVA